MNKKAEVRGWNNLQERLRDLYKGRFDEQQVQIDAVMILARVVDDLNGRLERAECYLAATDNKSGSKPLLLAAATSYDPKAAGAKCHACPLQGQKPVGPQEAKKGEAKFIIVGEGPGRQEERVGVPFVGPSGKLLDRSLKEAELDREEAHITNAMCCGAADDRPETKAQATACCAPRLARELSSLPTGAPVLALGAYAARASLGVRTILKSRGFIWQGPEIEEKRIKAAQKAVEKALKRRAGRPREEALRKARLSLWGLRGRKAFENRLIVPTIHPAFILRGQDTWLPVMEGDFKRFARVLSGDFEFEDEAPYEAVDTKSGIRKAVRQLKGPIALDIETTGIDPLTAKILCVGLSDGSKTFIIRWQKELAKTLEAVLHERVVVTHNGPQYDEIALSKAGVRLVRLEDTLIAAHAFASHLPKSLSFVVSIYCDARPWKILAKGKEGSDAAAAKGLAPWEQSEEELFGYNASDAKLTALAWRRIQADLEPERHTYEKDKQLALMCGRMTKAGFSVDVDKQKGLEAALKARKAGLLGAMRHLVKNPNFKPRKPADVRKALFGRFRAPMFKPTPSGLASTNNETLEHLKEDPRNTKASRLADMILKYRLADKILGTYVSDTGVGRDKRIHAPWKLGPVTGRFACWLMTLPRFSSELEAQVRDLFVAREGYKLVYYDLSQAEARMAAYLSGDTNLIEACEKDIHTENAKVVFSDSSETMRRLERANDKSHLISADGKPLKWKAVESKLGGCKDERDITKNVGFCVWYRGSPERAFITLVAKGFDATMGACEEMVSRFQRRYRDYYHYADSNIAFVRREGYLRSVLSGRIRWYGWNAPETEITNGPVQEGIAAIQNERLPLIEKGLSRSDRLIAQVHDAGIFEVREDKIEAVKRLITDVWAKPIIMPSGLEWVMPIDLKVGRRWSEFG